MCCVTPPLFIPQVRHRLLRRCCQKGRYLGFCQCVVEALNPGSAPVPTYSHFKVSLGLCPSNDEEKDYMYHVPYDNVVGSLMYAMVSTRPDISHVVGVVSRYMENPGKAH
jgi:hypothetical protein